MRKQLASLLAAVAVTVLASAPARAVDITFELSQLPNFENTGSLTVDGYTLLFSSIGSTFSVNSDANSGGIDVDVFQTFSIQKTAGAEDLIFKSYEISRVRYDTTGAKSFNLSGGTGTSNGNSLPASNQDSPVSFDFQGTYTMGGTETVQFDLVNFGVDFNIDTVRFHSLTFTPVPEPSTYALGAIATGVMAYVARRRKANRKG